MNKRIIIVLVALLVALMLVGCKATNSKPSLEIMPNDDNTISITADKAGISGPAGLQDVPSVYRQQILFFRIFPDNPGLIAGVCRKKLLHPF